MALNAGDDDSDVPSNMSNSFCWIKQTNKIFFKQIVNAKQTGQQIVYSKQISKEIVYAK